MTADRRRFARVPLDVRVTLYPPDGEPWIEARAHDVGLGGMGLICASPIAVHDEVLLMIHFETPSGLATERLLGRATNARVDDDASFVGVEFTTLPCPHSTPKLFRVLEAGHETRVGELAKTP